MADPREEREVLRGLRMGDALEVLGQTPGFFEQQRLRVNGGVKGSQLAAA